VKLQEATYAQHQFVELNFQNELCYFWMKTRNERLVISDLAVHKLLPFCTMYLCRHCQSWWSSSPNTDHFWKML